MGLKKNPVANDKINWPSSLSWGVHFWSQRVFNSMSEIPRPCLPWIRRRDNAEWKNRSVFQNYTCTPLCWRRETDGAVPRFEEKGGRRGEVEEKRPIHRWPGWECIGRSTRTLLPCPVGLGLLAVTGLIAAKSWNLDHSSTTEAGERARETDNKCGITAHAHRKCELNVLLLIKQHRWMKKKKPTIE